VLREQILNACKEDPESIVTLVTNLLATLQKLEARVKQLEDQGNKSSRNSGKPPSSDGYKKPAPKSLRVKGERSPGGQTGHEGHTLGVCATPDHVVVHPETHCACGHPVASSRILR
jgi:transposase